MSHWKWNNWTFRFQEITSGTNQRKTRCGRIGHMLWYFSVIREKCNKSKRIEMRKPPRRKIPSILDSREDENNRPYLARIMHGYLSTDQLYLFQDTKGFPRIKLTDLVAVESIVFITIQIFCNANSLLMRGMFSVQCSLVRLWEQRNTAKPVFGEFRRDRLIQVDH